MKLKAETNSSKLYSRGAIGYMSIEGSTNKI